jgi:hypothetical protein
MRTASPSRSQSMPAAATKRATLIEARLHDSKGSRGSSPQGLVLSMGPSSGVGWVALMRSRKMTPGSPPCQARLARRSKTLRAPRRRTSAPVRGFRSG